MRWSSRPLSLRIALLVVSLWPANGAIALSSSREVSQYAHRAWTTRHGLPHNGVRTILQTRDGYLWLGTAAGAVRFDGVRFTAFDKANTPGMRDEDVRAFAEDAEGNLWIGTYSGGLTRLKNGVSTFFGKADGLPNEMLRALHYDRAGNLWIGTYGGGLTRYRDGRFTTLTKKDGLADDQVKTIYEDRDGAIWVGTWTGGVSRIRNGTITNFSIAEGLPAKFVLDITQDRSGAMWFATYEGGLARWKDDRFTVYRKGDGLADDRVMSLLEDRHGNLWIGSYGKGLQRFTDGTFSSFSSKDGLSGDLVFDLFEDREGSVWSAAFDGGLDQLRDATFTPFTTAEGLASDLTFSVSADRNGVVWVATEGGGIARIENGRVTRTYTSADGLASDNVVAVLADRADRVWVGTFDGGGVNVLHRGAVKTYTTRDGLGSNFVWAIYEDPDGIIWLGTRGGGVSRFDGKRFTTISTADGLVHDRVRAIYRDATGVVWFATDLGISRLVGDRLHNFTRNDGLPAEAILAFHEDSDGAIWIGTRGGGLSRWAGGRFFNYGRQHGLPADTIFSILEDERGNLWMSSLRGVMVMSRHELEDIANGRRQAVNATLYGVADGMEESQCLGGSQPAGWKARDGRFWFPTAKGAVVVDPENLRSNTQPPPVYVERLIADRQPFLSPGAVLPAGSRNIEISYTAVTLQAPEKAQFRYMLEGFDAGWVDAGSRREAYYTNLHPGRYRFVVEAFNSDGLRSVQPATIEFALKPHFYQTAWFYLLNAIALAAVVFAIVRFRTKLVRAEASARTAELERSLFQVQKMDALGHMASGIAHEFNNTLMTVLPWSTILQKKHPNDPTVQKAASHIDEAVRRASSVTRQLLDFAQPKKPQKEAFDLVQLVTAELELLRASMPPEISIDLVAGGEVAIVEGDPDQIQQVVLNLALNARDAMPDGGTLRFEIRSLTAEESRAWAIDFPRPIVLVVSDTGTGLDEETRARIVDPFFTTKPFGRGTGLGLAVVNRIVEGHGGKFVVGPPGERGATFYVILRGAEVPPASSEPYRDEQEAAEALTGLNVMVVDDEAVVAEGIRALLESAGAAVVVHQSGLSALAHIAAGLHPDVIVLDLGMPEMSGEQVHAMIRKRLPRVPIVISSGYGDPARIDPLLQDGFTTFRQKPYEPDEFIRHVAKIADRVPA